MQAPKTLLTASKIFRIICPGKAIRFPKSVIRLEKLKLEYSVLESVGVHPSYKQIYIYFLVIILHLPKI